MYDVPLCATCRLAGDGRDKNDPSCAGREALWCSSLRPTSVSNLPVSLRRPAFYSPSSRFASGITQAGALPLVRTVRPKRKLSPPPRASLSWPGPSWSSGRSSHRGFPRSPVDCSSGFQECRGSRAEWCVPSSASASLPVAIRPSPTGRDVAAALLSSARSCTLS